MEANQKEVDMELKVLSKNGNGTLYISDQKSKNKESSNSKVLVI
jgi:hypothetical protein